MISQRELEVHEAAWLAGLIDGEGNVGVKKSYSSLDGYTNWYPILNVTMTCQETIDYLHSLTPGGNTKPRNLGGNRKLQYVWSLSAVDKVLFVVKTIRPYSVTKKSQLAFLEEICKRKIEVGRSPGRRINDPYLTGLCEKLATMNRKGIQAVEQACASDLAG